MTVACVCISSTMEDAHASGPQGALDHRRIFDGLMIGIVLASAIEVIFGLVLLPFYRSDAGAAYSSIQRIQSSALYFVEGFHHWLSAVLIFIGVIVLLYGLYTGAFRGSGPLRWISSVLLVASFLLFQLTGHLLPWDQHAVQTASIETGIAANAPYVGAAQANFLRAGSEIGPHTLTLWYWAHIGLGIAWLILCLLVVRLAKATGYSVRSLRWSAVVLLVFSLIMAFAERVHFGPAATTADMGGYSARPEWYILPLHSLMTLFQSIGPKDAFYGTMVIPGVIFLLVVLAPWLDRSKNHWERSAYGITLSLLLVIAAIALSSRNAKDVALLAGPNVYASSSAPAPNTSAKLDPKLVAEGKSLLNQQGCMDCHTMAPGGGGSAPALNGTGSRHPDLQWQEKHLMNPSSESPGSTMPSFASIGQAKIQALAEYLESLK